MDATRSRLKLGMSDEVMKRTHIELRNHKSFPDQIAPGSVSVITYNLGYLPGGDKTITTNVETTLTSIEAACNLVVQGGLISIMCYRGI